MPDALPVIVTSSSSPDYLLSFDEIVFKGYDADDERNKKESISIYKYPLCLYVAYKQIVRRSKNPRLRYVSDVQRYSTILGHAIIEHAPWYVEIEEQYNTACDSENPYIQDALDSTKGYTFATTSKASRRGIKTLFYIKESLETKSNVLGINCTDLAILCSLFGLENADLPKKVKSQIKTECDYFRNYVPFVKKMYVSFHGESPLV